jgi:chitin disaccharide deacetylase
MARLLIVNADDLGISQGVNKGILETHLRGIVTSTTAMINQPDVAAGIQLAKQHAPGLGLGLHITLTRGRPVLPPDQVPSLVRSDGHFYGRAQFSRVSTLFRAQDLRAEIQAQFDRFVQLAGHLPDHIDSHHYAAYLHPVAFEIILDLVARHQLPLRSARNYMNVDIMSRVFTARGYNHTTVKALAESILRVYESHQQRPRWPDNTERRFYHEGANLDNLCRILADLPEGVTELMCHPGYADDLEDDYHAPRDVERQALTHPRAREIIERRQIKLITFAQIPDRS